MPRRHPNLHNNLIESLVGSRADVDGLQRQQTSFITDPRGSSGQGDPDNGYATVAMGYLGGLTGIPAYGLAVWDNDAAAWVQITAAPILATVTRTAPPYVIANVLSNGALPTFPIHVPPGQTATLIGVVAYTQSGTVSVAVQKQGTTIGGLGSISASSSSTSLVTPSSTTQINDQDQFGIVLSSASGTGLTVSIAMDVTV